MTDITLIFPDQLFLNHPCISPERAVYLVEEFLFYKVQPFHKQRLVLLKAAMRSYAEMLLQKKIKVIHIKSRELSSRGQLIEILEKRGVKSIHVAEFADEWLHQDLQKGADKYGWNIHFHPSPAFLSSNEELKCFFKGKKHYSMAQFYAYQRKSRDILMEGNTPFGGKYSFDTENRKKLPKGLAIPPFFSPSQTNYIDEVISEVEDEFPDAIGKATPFLYPVNHQEARRALEVFLTDRLSLYGDYQDSIDREDSFLFHSVLSPLLNIGLLTPKEVIETALNHPKRSFFPINSLEGFIRQIIGWREFVRASYLMKGGFQRSSNFFYHREKIPKKFWEGSTGILPIDTTIKRVLKTGYCNHIERLMVLGNFLLLTETSPHEVYKWFMGCFIDAYDWVMVSNVYGMSQYADGGAIVTKPYVSSSNYISKMSNYPKGGWTEIWDGLFWRFLQKHQSLFSSNNRTMALLHILKKNETSILPKIQKSELWLADYRSSPSYYTERDSKVGIWAEPKPRG